MVATILALSLLFLVGATVARVSAQPHERTVTEPGDIGVPSGSNTAGAKPGAVEMGAWHPGRRPSSSQESPGSVTVTVPARYRGRSASAWAHLYRDRTRELAAARAMTHKLIVRKWQPTVMYAIRLASAVTGVPVYELAPVAHCESTYNPLARNGKYKGVFQLSWLPFGIFSPYDPVANALSAAMTVAHDGSWRQWQCKP